MQILAKIDYDGVLSTEAYLILAGMFLIIVGGLGWCLYRALTAEKKESSQQMPDEV